MIFLKIFIYIYKSKILIRKLKFIISSYFSIKAGVSQGSLLSPDIIFKIYMTDIPVTKNATIATYSDVTAIFCASDVPDETSNLLKIYLDSIDNWATKCRIKINEDKSV